MMGLLRLDSELFATTYQVVPSRSYVSPIAFYTAIVLAAGDTLEIDAGISADMEQGRHDLRNLTWRHLYCLAPGKDDSDIKTLT